MQQRETVYFDGEDGDGPQELSGRAWVDVATVTVPAKTKRKTVIERAVVDMEIEGTVYLRVIPAENAKAIKVEMEQPPPQLRIGER